MKLELIGSNDENGLRDWDAFLMESLRGHYALLSTWLRSYGPYGFDFNILVARNPEDGAIAGGIGLLNLGNRLLFKIVTAPVGPIVDVGFESLAEPIMRAAVEHARNSGAALLQLRYPCAADGNLTALLSADALPVLTHARVGAAFDVGNAPAQMLWVGFPEAADQATWRDQLFRRFEPQTRNKIRIGERQGLEVYEARTETELREAYSIMEVEALNRGAAFRSWNDFGSILLEQVERGQAMLVAVRHQGRVIASRYGLLAGRRFSYIAGARVPVDKLKVGQYLTWAVMEKARDRGLIGYDFTSIGDPGVMRFKDGFRPQHINLVPPQYLVFSAIRHGAFNLLYRRLRKHRFGVSRVLSAVHRSVHRRVENKKAAGGFGN